MIDNKYSLTEIFRKFLVKIDIILHIVAALLLLTACFFILFYSFQNILNPGRETILHLINDVLMALIILELLWTVIRFLKKQQFSLGPFLAIGIIAAIRRILLIEAQTSYMEHVPVEKLYEMGLSALVILILMVAYFLSFKTQQPE
ncbi:MAG: phosphate-starvation-inducible PsiE family protein [Candidatus Magnetoovum sp. WYHC-5]|nr:phosphate-starvation-inducible PsiE family protein [Candidatus Magnetoovum sp. WYHC-5]